MGRSLMSSMLLRPIMLCAVPVDGGVARADVGDGLADGLPDGAAPAGVEGAHDLLAAVGGRSGGEPEGVEALDAGEGGLEGWVRHFGLRDPGGHCGARALAVSDGVDDLAAAVGAVAAGEVFGVGGLAGGAVDEDAAALELHLCGLCFAAAEKLGVRGLADGEDDVLDGKIKA